MAKYLSNRQKNLKIGISSYTENNTVLEVIGNVGIGTTNAKSAIDIVGDAKISGVVTATTFNGQINAGVSTFTGITTVTGSTLFAKQLNVSGVSTIGNFIINPIGSGANVGSPGIVTYYGDGSQLNGLIANTIQNIDDNQTYYPLLSPSTSGTISSISVSSSSIVFNPGPNNLGIGSTQPRANLDILGTIRVSSGSTFDGAVQLNSTLSQGNSAATFSQTTQAFTVGSQTSGALTLGGTSQTGTITLGRATTSQTTNIQSGVTASGNTKTINFGTGGGAGSFTQINVGPTSGVGTVLINTGTNLGIGSATPTSKLDVIGDAKVSGVVTATTFIGALTGTATTATKLATARTFEITGDIIASPISFDGTGNVSLAATIQPNSVGLGTDTTGDYVTNITGTLNQITVTSGTGEGSTPTLSIPSQFNAPQDVTVTRDLQVNRNLNVTGNITIGGTSAFINATELRVSDPDIILGFRSDINNNDISTDNTANHGGIAIASTEGTPLISLYDVGVGETNPATYKKFMWFKSGTFSGLGTDAWLSNYAIGIGSTQFPTGTRLAAGSVQFTEKDLAVVRNINSSGVGTIPTLSGTTATYGTGNFTTGNIVTGVVTTLTSTNATLTNINSSGISTLGTTSATSLNVSGISTLPTLSGTTATYNTGNFTTGNIVTGVVTTLSGTTATYGTGNFTTGNIVTGVVTTLTSTNATLTNINSSGISTLGVTSTTNLTTQQLNVSGVSTLPTLSGTTATYGTGNFTTGNVVTGVITTLSGTTATYNTGNFTTGNVVTGVVTTLTSTNATLTNINSSGISTLGVTSTTNLTAQQLNVSGVSTFAGITTVTGNTLFARQLNVSGITTSSRITLNGANNTANGGGQIYLNGSTGNRIDFNTNGTGAPTFTTRSAGTKIVLYPTLGPSDTDYALGITNGTLWYSVGFSGAVHRWYAGTTQLADLKGTGELVIGSTNLTGTSNQNLQVNSGAYVSGSIGVGNTNPTSKLDVVGDAKVSGVVTATTFIGSLTGTATSTTNIPNLSGDITSVNTVTTLATVNGNVGTYGDAGAIPRVTVNAKGLVTGVSTVAPNNGTLTLSVSGTGLSGSSTFTANQSGNSTFTVTSNATSDNTNNTIVSRNASGGFSAGIITATQFSTGASGTGINITTNTLSGPAELIIDPAAVGDNTGAVRIKGDLYVDGTQTIINSTTIELADFNVGIATTVGTNLLLDGAGIGIGSTNIRKTINWNNTLSALSSSENWNLASGKNYKIGGTDVLTSTTLGTSVVNSSLTSVGTLGQLNVSGVSTLGITTFTGTVSFGTSAYFGDNGRAYFGDSNDLEIYHSGTNSFILDNGTGNLVLGTNGDRISIVKGTGTETLARFNIDDSVELWFNNVKEFETTGYGATVFGVLQSQGLHVNSGVSTFNGNVSINNGTGNVLDLNNGTLFGVGNIVINDPGPDEGIQWNGGNGWRIYEAPDSLANSGGNLQFNLGSGRLFTMRTDGSLSVPGIVTSTGINVSGVSTVGFLTATNIWNSGITTASAFVKIGGTSSQFLKADGSVDTNNYISAESDTLNTVTTRGNATTNGISVGVLTATSGNFSGIITSSGLNVSGVVTAVTFNGQVNAGVGTITSLNSTSAIITNLSGTNLNYSGIGTLSRLILTANGAPTTPQLQFTGSTSAWIDFGQIGVGVPAFTTRSAGTKLVLWNRVDGSNVDYAFGISSGPDTLWSSVSSPVARFAWYAGTSEIASLSGTGNLNVSGVVTATTFSGQVNAGVGTITTLSGTTATYTNGNLTTLNATTGNIVTGVVTTLSGTTATYGTGNFTTGNIVTGVVTTLTSTNATLTNINSSGISTLGVTSTTNLTAQQLNVSGISTFAGITTVTGETLFAKQLNVSGVVTASSFSGNASSATYASSSGIATYASSSGIATYATTAGIATYATSSGIATYASSSGIATYASTAGIATYATSSGIATYASTAGIATYATTAGIATYATSSGIASALTASASINTTGIITAAQFTTGIGNLGFTTNTINGPSEIIIDPSPVGVGTTSGVVRIRGDLYVDGTQFIVNSSTIELADFNVGIATTVGTNLLLDGAGIGIGSTGIRKTITWNNTAGALTSSEDWNLVSGKQYEINGTSVLNATTLGSGVVNSSLTSVGTLGQLNVSGVVTATTFNGQINAGVGTITTLSGTTATYNTGNFTTGNIVTGVVTTLTSTNATLTNINSSGISTLGVTSTTNLTAQKLNVSGVSTFTQISAGGTTGINQYVLTSTGTGILWQSISALEGVTGFNVSADTTTSASLYVPFVSTSAGTTSVQYVSTNQLTFKPLTGSLGIGTTNPTSKLTVQGNVNISGITTLASSGGITTTGGNFFVGNQLNVKGNSYLPYIYGSSGAEFNQQVFFNMGSETGYAEPIAIRGNSSGAVVKWLTPAGDTGFVGHKQAILGGTGYDYTIYTTASGGGFGVAAGGRNTYDLFVTSSGNTGIGITNPTSKLTVQGNVNVSGVITATTFNGQINAGISTLGVTSTTNLTAQQLNVSGVSTFAGITTVTGNTLFAKQLNVSGISTFAGITTVTGNTLFAKQLNVSGVVTATTFNGQINAGFGTITTLSGTTATYGTGNFTTGNVVTGVVTTLTSTNATLTNINSSGISTLGVTSTTNLTAQQLNVSGVSTFAGITTVTGNTLFARQLNVSGVTTASAFIKIGGTSSQFLKADGSVDSNTYLTTESDTLNTVTTRDNATTNGISVGVLTATSYNTTYYLQGSSISSTSSTSTVGIHSAISSTTYRSVEYMVQATEGSKFHTTKVLVIHDGTTAYLTEYGTIYNNSTLATYDVDISGGNIRLLSTPASSGITTYIISFMATKV